MNDSKWTKDFWSGTWERCLATAATVLLSTGVLTSANSFPGWFVLRATLYTTLVATFGTFLKCIVANITNGGTGPGFGNSEVTKDNTSTENGQTDLAMGTLQDANVRENAAPDSPVSTEGTLEASIASQDATVSESEGSTVMTTDQGGAARPDAYLAYESGERVEYWGTTPEGDELPDPATARHFLAMIDDADDIVPTGTEDGLVTTDLSDEIVGAAGFASARAFGFTSPAPVGKAAQVISKAKSQVGYREGRSGKSWNNDQKYSKSQPELAWSNRMAWCATFVCWCFREVFGNYKPIFGSTAAVAVFRDRAKANNRFSEYPAVGAVLILGRSGVHTGIVYAYDNTYIYTVEGNTNDSGSPEGNGVYLKRRTRKSVYGYLYPAYPEGIASADPKWGNSVKPGTVTATAAVTPGSRGIARGWRRTDRPYVVDMGNAGTISVAAVNRAVAADVRAPDGVKGHCPGDDRAVYLVLSALARMGLVSWEYQKRGLVGTTTVEAINRFRHWVGPSRGWSEDDMTDPPLQFSVGKATLEMMMYDSGINARIVD